jgi:eukaryotic-like serine/threonine-protein kinase
MSVGPGSRLDAYELVRPLGSGGMGEVWLATELRLGRKVALKLLPAELTRDAVRVRRFEQEARAASALNHPNVCTILALGETDDGQHYLAMELVEGETLRHRLSVARLSIREALDIAIQVAAALSAAHAAGIVHRDVKPENVMLRADGLVKVLDFGLAKLASTAPELACADTARTVLKTDVGVVVGTLGYMSPEQARGQEVDTRTDIWALGVVLYEMVAGRSPFAGPSGTDILAAILDREPSPLARFEPEAPRELQRISAKTLQKDREQRYQSMKDLLLDLRALHDTSAAHTTNQRLEHEASRSGRVRADEKVGRLTTRKLVIALIACVVAVTAAGGWWMASRRQPSPQEIPSVVVLPFDTIGNAEQYFAHGITEAVTTEVGRFGGLRVIASNTAFAYRNRASNREIARQLGVQLVIRGAVQRAGERVRIDVSLVDAGDDTALWSERYNRQVGDVLMVQDEISTQIAATLSRRFGARPGTRPVSRAARNPEAYDAYLRGLWHLKGRSVVSPGMDAGAEQRRLAVVELERAIAADPSFAVARAALASAYAHQFFYDTTHKELEQRASQQIELALAIEPELAEAYLARAQLTWTAAHGFPHASAIEDLRRAVSANPNLAEAYIELEKVYYHIGLTDRAVDAHQRAQRLDPSRAASNDRAFRALLDAGRLAGVQFELERNRNLEPIARAEALIAIGRLDDALRLLLEFKDSERVDGEYDPILDALLGVVYARLGRRGDAERVIATLTPRAENPTALSHMHHAQFYIGAALAWLGRDDEAVKWLTKAALEGYPSYPKFSTDQSLEPLRRQHAGFRALLERLRSDWDRWQKAF